MFAPPKQYIPQRTNGRGPILLWAILVLGSFALVGLIFAAPALYSRYGLLAATLYQAFSHVCHQQPERSFFLFGHPLAVCARCTGLYFGFAVSALVYPLIISLRRTNPPERKWLFLALAPLAIDFGLGLLGVWENTHSSRFLTGALFGAVVVLYVMPALAELKQRFSTTTGVRHQRKATTAL